MNLNQGSLPSALDEKIDLKKISTTDNDKSMCEISSILPTVETLENICKFVIKSDLCKDINEKDLLKCDSSHQDANQDLWSYIRGCTKGFLQSASEILEFIWDILRWSFDNSSSDSKSEDIDQESEYINVVKLYLYTEYEKAYEKSSDPFRELEAARIMGGQVSQYVLGILTDLIRNKLKELDCLNQEAKTKVICKFLGDVTIPPAAFFALIKTGAKALNKYKHVAKAFEELDKYKKTLKIKIYKTAPMRSKYKDETTGAVFGTNVKYFTKAESLEFKVGFTKGKLLDANGNLLNVNNAKYVMDESGAIFVYEKHKNGYIHHSSLIEGQPVAAAGYITVTDGVVSKINRKSGHYRPTEEMLNQFIEELRRQGAKLKDVKIDAYE